MQCLDHAEWKVNKTFRDLLHAGILLIDCFKGTKQGDHRPVIVQWT